MKHGLVLSLCCFCCSPIVWSAPPQFVSEDIVDVRQLSKESAEHLKQAERLFARALYHLQQAQEGSPAAFAPPKRPVSIGSHLHGVSRARELELRMGGIHRGAVGGMRRSARTNRKMTRLKKATGDKKNKKKDDPKGSDSKEADKQRRELDENYDRGKRGFRVLKWGLKIVKKIPVVKKFIPKGASETVDGASKVSDDITAPKDGFANINGELKVWNSRTKRWEDF